MLQTTNKVSKPTLTLSLVLFLGVLWLAYGYFQKSSLALVGGLLVIAVGAISGILQIAVRGRT